MDSAMTALTLDAEVSVMARAKAQPKVHRYELVQIDDADHARVMHKPNRDRKGA